MRTTKVVVALAALALVSGASAAPARTFDPFVSENEIRTQWNQLVDGKPGMTVKTHLVRKTS